MRTALVVFSGGQDSTTCLYWAKSLFDKVHAITFDYGQRHRIEVLAAKKIAQMANIASHEIVTIPQNLLKSVSPLTSDSKLDTYDSFEAMEAEVGDRVEKTFVPMRNALFLTIAANHALWLDCSHLVTGICNEDNANYPDCTWDFAVQFETMIHKSLGAKRVTLCTPLLTRTKAQTVQLASSLPGCMEALAYSHTSYDGRYPPTGKNHANLLRAKGFEEAGIADPLVLRAHKEGLMELPSTSNYDKHRK